MNETTCSSKSIAMFTTACLLGIGSVAYFVRAADEPRSAAGSQNSWKAHDMTRPRPPVITPGTASTEEQPGKPPSDAIVLFEGKDLSHWQGQSGGAAPWKIENGAMQADKESIITKEPFGDMQLHLEWSTPTPAEGSSQGRGNSGVMLMGGRYEIQVLDSFQNDTYPDGQAAAVYGQYPPLVNASRPPGQWQTYDILWRAPRFKNGQLDRPARVTVMHNGIYVQDDVELLGGTAAAVPSYTAHGEKEPFLLQFHGNPVRYRNIWVRPLPEPAGKPMLHE